MTGYMLLLNDSTQIHDSEQLVEKCSSWSRSELIVFKTFSFINCTCYMRTVQEEIEFVIDSQKSRGVYISSVTDFVNTWKLSQYLDTEVFKLSGGWRKYLGLALFTNRKSQGKLYMDSLRHLSDTLIYSFFENLNLYNDEIVIFAEYETGLLSNYKLVPLFDHGDRLSLARWQDQFIHNTSETNYENVID